MKANMLIAAVLVFVSVTGGFADDQPAVPAPGPGDGSGHVGKVPDGTPAERFSFTVYSTWNAFDAMQSLIAHFQNGRKSLPIQFMPYDSDQVIGKLGRHECDVALPFDSFIPTADHDAADQVQKFPLGLFVVAVAVNPSNPVRAMPMGDLQKAFAFNPILISPPWDGTNGGFEPAATARRPSDPPEKSTTPWKIISGSHSDMPIEEYRPGKFGPEGWFFQKRVLSGGPFADEFSRESIALHEKKSDAEIIDAISKQAGAVGFFRCPFEMIKGKHIRILGIAKDKDSPPVPPSPETLADGIGDYPLADTLTLYLRPDAPAEALEFCKFAAGPEGVAILKECGFWPEYELKEVRATQRVLAAKRGKGEIIVVLDSTGNNALLQELGQEFVRAAAPVQLKIHGDANIGELPAASERDAAAQELRATASDLLLAVKSTTDAGGATSAAGERKLPGVPTLAKDRGAHATADAQSASQPRAIPFGKVALGVVANPTTLLKSLTLDELRQVGTGRIKNWPAAKGEGPAIHTYGLHDQAPVMRIWKKFLAQGTEAGNRGSRAIAEPKALADTAKVLLAVARDPAGIGLVDLSALPPDDKSVTLLSLVLPDGTKVTPRRTVKAIDTSGKPGGASKQDEFSSVVPAAYPLAETCEIYVSPNAGPAAKRFADWLAAGHGDGALLAHGLMPPVAEREALNGLPEIGAPGPENGATRGEAPASGDALDGAGAQASAEPGLEGPTGVPASSVMVSRGNAASRKVAPPGTKELEPGGRGQNSGGRNGAGAPNDDKGGGAQAADSEMEDRLPAVMILLGLAGGGGFLAVLLVRKKKRPTGRQSPSPLRDWDVDFASDSSGQPEALAAPSLVTKRLSADFDPYHKWLGIPPGEQPPNHYRLLGLAALESDREVIEEAADRQMAHLRTFQLGQYAALSQELLGEVSAAKGCLLSPTKKPIYDAHLRRRLAAC